jgi:hypothetical protein
VVSSQGHKATAVLCAPRNSAVNYTIVPGRNSVQVGQRVGVDRIQGQLVGPGIAVLPNAPSPQPSPASGRGRFRWNAPSFSPMKKMGEKGLGEARAPGLDRRQGRAFLRYILYMPAIVAKKHNPVIMVFCKRLADRKLPEMAIVVAEMRKLLHVVFGVLNNQTPFDPILENNSLLPLDF